jgi:hypothetical protein
MNLLKEFRELKTGPHELRKFGVTGGGVFLLLGAWMWFRHNPVYPWLLWGGVAFVLSGLVWPGALRWIYLGWMTLAFILGHIVSTVLLALFFYFVVTPVGLLARLAGRDFLNRKRESNSPSYWIIRDRSKLRGPTQYEKQF